MPAESWTTVTLGDFVDIKHGYAFAGEHFRENPTGEILLTPGNFAVGGGFKSDKFKYYDGPTPREYALEAGDLLVSMTDLSKNSDTLGLPMRVPRIAGFQFLHNQRLGKVTAKRNAFINLDFIFYVLTSAPYRAEIKASSTGTTVKHTSPSRICNYSFALPHLAEQQAIAEVLGALDDKIELNRRMNATLEELARTIFRSWFVDFDPVHAKAEGRAPFGMDADTATLFPDSFAPSELGDIPAGWSVQPFDEVISINPKRTLKKGELATYLDMGNMPTNGARALDWYLREVGSGSKFENGDVLLARITPCLENGKTALVDFLRQDEVGWGSTEYIVLRSILLPNVFAYCIARSEPFRQYAIQNMNGSSGRQRVSADALRSYSLTVPNPQTADRFQQVIAPMFDKLRSNDDESRTLSELRDTLLPKLLSGEITVKAAKRELVSAT